MDKYEEMNAQMIGKMKELSAAVDRRDLAAVERLDGEVKALLDQMSADVRAYVATNRLGTNH